MNPFIERTSASYTPPHPDILRVASRLLNGLRTAMQGPDPVPASVIQPILDTVEDIVAAFLPPQPMVVDFDAMARMSEKVNLGKLLREKADRRNNNAGAEVGGFRETLDNALRPERGHETQNLSSEAAEILGVERTGAYGQYRGEPTPGARVSAPPWEEAVAAPVIEPEKMEGIQRSALRGLKRALGEDLDLEDVLDIYRLEGRAAGCQVLSKARVIVWIGNVYMAPTGGVSLWLAYDTDSSAAPLFHECRGNEALAQAAKWLIDQRELRS